jgi:hypothetical protein
LANVQREAHNVLSEAVKKVINSPISSKDGIYGVLKGGAFMSPAKVLSIPEVADQLRKVTMAMSMNLVLRAMVNLCFTLHDFHAAMMSEKFTVIYLTKICASECVYSSWCRCKSCSYESNHFFNHLLIELPSEITTGVLR